MRSKHVLVLIGLLTPCLLWAGESNLVLTIDGVTYSNVTWGAATPATVKLVHAAGIAAVPLEKLPDEWQKHFNYGSAKAAAYRAANTPQPDPSMKMLDRVETGKALKKAIDVHYVNFGCTKFEDQNDSWSWGEAHRDNVDAVRWRYKQLLELQKTGHSDYRAAVDQFVEACKRAIERHYELKKGPLPRASDHDTTKAAADVYNNSLKQLLDEANARWAEGLRLKTLADSKGYPVPPPPKPKPTPTNPYLEEVP